MSIYMWRVNHLCFTANTAGSTVQLTQTWSPASVSLETSTNWWVWTSYTIWDTITLSSIGDAVSFRNTSTTTTSFSDYGNYYQFVMTWSISASWDITSLINKNCTDTLISAYCFYALFSSCTALTTAPELPATSLSTWCYSSMFAFCTWLTEPPSFPATTLQSQCYNNMFNYCTNLTALPKLPATKLANNCYNSMFQNCSNIRVYTYNMSWYSAYRIPFTWTGTTATNALNNMFYNTGWNVTTPSINTTYYTSNTLV